MNFEIFKSVALRNYNPEFAILDQLKEIIKEDHESEGNFYIHKYNIRRIKNK